MPSLPRKKCPACKRSVPVRSNGAFREHKREALAGPDKCPGSGKSPTEARKIARAEAKLIEEGG